MPYPPERERPKKAQVIDDALGENSCFHSRAIATLPPISEDIERRAVKLVTHAGRTGGTMA